MSHSNRATQDRQWTNVVRPQEGPGDWQQWAVQVGEFGDLAQEAASAVSAAADKDRGSWNSGFAIAAVIAVGLGALWLAASSRSHALTRISQTATRLGNTLGRFAR